MRTQNVRKILSQTDRLIGSVSILVLFLLLVSACSTDKNVFTQSSASLDGSGSGGAVDSTTGFKISVSPIEGVSSLLHAFGNTSATCEIPLSAKDSPTDLQCMYNIMEYDLFFYGLTLEMNVPVGFCEFIEEVPYRFYTHRPGVVPPQVTMTETSGAISACSWNGVAGTVTAGGTLCTSPDLEATITPDGTVRCAYDYSTTLNGSTAGPNCCIGRIQKVINGDPTSPQEFNGSLNACTESPHNWVDTWPKLVGGPNRFAITRITQLGIGGLSSKTKLPSVLSLAAFRSPVRANFLQANFYNWTSYIASPSTWFSAVTPPRMIAPSTDLSGDVMPSASNGSYSFRCLGPAGELRHRISLYVNAWNTKEDFDAYRTTGTLTATGPNRQGTAGVDCNSVSTGAQSCDNFWSIDDLIRAPAAFYLGGGGSATAHAYPQEQSRPAPP